MPLPIITTVPQHTQEQWLFTDEELNATPSILQGMPVAEERSRRAKGVNFITQAGILLKLPQVTLGTASMFFHRLFMRMGMDEKYGGIHHYNIAATALFLATKSEENCRKTTDIVIAVAKIAGKNPLLIVDQQSKEFWKWKDNILAYEELMLELLTFDVVLDSPYTHLYHLLRTLGVEERKELRNVAWAFVNDSQLTMLGLMMPAKDIAVAAIFFAARFTGGEIEDTDEDEPWWKRVDGDEQKIIKAVTVLHDFYTNNPLKKIDAHEGEPPRSPEDLNSTRRRRAIWVNESSEKGDVDMDSPSDGKSHKKEPSDESKTSEGSRTTRGNATQRESTHKKEPSDENGWGEPKTNADNHTNAGDNTNPWGDESTHQKEKSDESKISEESQTTFGNATQPRESTLKKEPSDENAWGETPTKNTEAQSGETKVGEMAREDGDVRGDSDVKLKEAANDPATHQDQKRSADEEAARSEDGSVANGVGEMHIAQELGELRGGAGRLVPPSNGGSEGNLSVKRKAEEDVEMEEGEASETKRPRASEREAGEREEGELE